MSKNLRKTFIWILFASAITSITFWQAQVAVAKGQKTRQVVLPRPIKTRHAIRPLELPSLNDPIASFNSRLSKGLTNREVGWIIEDFKTAGLDREIRVASQEEFLTQRRAQDLWYREAVVEGWSLSHEQSLQFAAKLSALYERAKAEFLETIAAGPQPFKHNGKWFTITGTEPIHRLIDANLRLQDTESPYMPWSIAEFLVKSPSQSSTDIGNIDAAAGSPAKVANTGSVQTHPTEPSLLTVNLLLPKILPSLEIKVTHEKQQKQESLSSIRTLHPSQLKLLLLIEPGRAKTIEAALVSPQ